MEYKNSLELGDIVDCLSMADQEQPHRLHHGAHRGREEV